jgi:DNA-binding transcriptional ArsR family regulator
MRELGSNQQQPLRRKARSARQDPSAAAHPRRRERLGGEVIELTAQHLRVLAEPNRIALLEALNDGEAGVQGLSERLGAPHQNVSHHLTVLHQAGIVSRRREGSASRYSVDDWSAWWVIEQIGRWVQSCLDEQRGQELPG